MATGYTCDIAEKDNYTFREYAIKCARAFGASIILRDESSDIEVNEENVRGNSDVYHQEQIDRTNQELKNYLDLSDSEKRKRFEKHVKCNRTSYKQELEKISKLKAKYEKILAEVDSYHPPTPEHEGFKKFMREQLVSSIDFDCNTNYYNKALLDLDTLTFEAWENAKLAELERSISYHVTEKVKAIELDDERSAWVKALKDSLK